MNPENSVTQLYRIVEPEDCTSFDQTRTPKMYFKTVGTADVPGPSIVVEVFGLDEAERLILGEPLPRHGVYRERWIDRLEESGETIDWYCTLMPQIDRLDMATLTRMLTGLPDSLKRSAGNSLWENLPTCKLEKNGDITFSNNSVGMRLDGVTVSQTYVDKIEGGIEDEIEEDARGKATEIILPMDTLFPPEIAEMLGDYEIAIGIRLAGFGSESILKITEEMLQGGTFREKDLRKYLDPYLRCYENPI